MEDTALVNAVIGEVGKRVVGQDYMIDRLLISLLTGGHVLLEGVPGLAKTLTVRTLAETIDTTFQRIQFTPDLLPADVLGTQVYDQSTGQFLGEEGADLREHHPRRRDQPRAGEGAGGAARGDAGEAGHDRRHDVSQLEEPFLVLATQNPIEQEGTYPLPEAQVDRFMLKLRVGYPTRDEEKEIMRRMAGRTRFRSSHVATPEAILGARRRIAELYMDDRIVDYIVDIVHATRESDRRGAPRSRAADRVRREPARDDRARAGVARASPSCAAARSSRRTT